ncbi:hypothetical protein [Nonomuraea typhae]|uniref:hypothetical protein n=1 Tax=Nonomuraea typhae TaxID=2603600 RepID=UPI0012FCBD62|nr:hypothetical protein [Nonomuraea typhae]
MPRRHRSAPTRTHDRMCACVLAFLVVLAALGGIAGMPGIAVLAVLLAVITGIDMFLVVHRQIRGRS